MAIIQSYRSCEFTTVFRDGAPQTWPVSPLFLADGRLLPVHQYRIPPEGVQYPP